MQNLNKQLIRFAIIACLAPTISLAQEPEENLPCRGRLNNFYKELNLTKEQQQSIKDLYKSKKNNSAAIHKKYWDKLPAEEKQNMEQELNAVNDQTENKIKEILTAEQQSKYDAIQQTKKQRREERKNMRTMKQSTN